MTFTLVMPALFSFRKSFLWIDGGTWEPHIHAWRLLSLHNFVLDAYTFFLLTGGCFKKEAPHV